MPAGCFNNNCASADPEFGSSCRDDRLRHLGSCLARLRDEMVSKARKRLFGSWEMNWMAYNYAHDVALPGSAKPPLVYFMYPQAETADGRTDPFDPDNFKYEITVKEMS